MSHQKLKAIFISVVLLIGAAGFQSFDREGGKTFKVIAYYAGGPSQVSAINPRKITHIIYSFCTLQGTQLNIGGASNAETIRRLVALKKVNPKLKVMLSMGGWGGCKTCSDLFSDSTGRQRFSESVARTLKAYRADGIDLDWEYPSIEGFPGHKYSSTDKQNFTLLLKQLRETLGQRFEISFAAGGFQEYLDSAVEWREVVKYADRINLMTYDLVNGNSTITGHHTALYSTPDLSESADNAVSYLLGQGIPANKLVIGAAFYGREWSQVEGVNNGLYQPGVFKRSIIYKAYSSVLTHKNGFYTYWDSIAKAPYAYNPAQKLFVTFDDKRSVELKTRYALEKGLDGIMFWQITQDRPDGLIETINKAKNSFQFTK